MASSSSSRRITGGTHYLAQGRVWIEGPDGTFLGHGRVVLLERIREHGSISAAARSMNMSYRQAWKLVASMNRQSNTPVVSMSTGGRGGGGAQVTEAGERAIAIFRSFRERFDEFLAAQMQRFDFG